MRQAGRYLPEYRELRGDRDILETIRTPEQAVEVTLQPLRRMPVDAAILFSDIVVPLVAVGVPIRIEAGRGPVLDDPFRGDADLARLRPLEPEADEPYVLETVRLLAKELQVPLIGFAGAPFTLASYAIEGGHSNNFARTKALMYGTPAAWHRLCERLSGMSADYLAAQVEAGVDAVQVFDSWVGALNASDYREFILPHTRRIFERLSAFHVPVIHFGVGTGAILAELREAGGDVIGADWRTPLDEAWQRIGPDRAIQGNLDPTLLLGPLDRALAATDDVLARAGGRPGHIFNLGHGILPGTPVDHVQAIARYVHQKTRR